MHNRGKLGRTQVEQNSGVCDTPVESVQQLHPQSTSEVGTLDVLFMSMRTMHMTTAPLTPVPGALIDAWSRKS